MFLGLNKEQSYQEAGVRYLEIIQCEKCPGYHRPIFVTGKVRRYCRFVWTRKLEFKEIRTKQLIPNWCPLPKVKE
jgi:hypothetical protein